MRQQLESHPSQPEGIIRGLHCALLLPSTGLLPSLGQHLV